MPTVISLLNSYAGLSAAAMGFVLDNKLLIITGALDGSSGLILSIIMCRAMNRSFTNVLFGAFGQVDVAQIAAAEQRSVRSASAEEAAQLLASASSVVIVPGYGMAVAQAQHKVRELFDSLSRRHPLVNLLLIALCAVIAGADTWEEIQAYAHAPKTCFARWLDLQHGIPSQDPFARVFARLEPTQ